MKLSRYISIAHGLVAFALFAGAAAVFGSGPATAPVTPAQPVADEAEAPAATVTGRALLARYCVDCHNEKKAKGKLNLAAVGHDPARPEFANAWRQGVGRVRQLEMPPEDAPQPTPAEREALTGWMQWNLDRVVAAAPVSAGRV